jgi:hypothetical protein
MKHCFLAKKILLKPKLALIKIIWTQEDQPLRSGLLSKNEAKCASKAMLDGRPKEAVSDENIKKPTK